MSKSKTPDYVLRANANYRKKHTTNKAVQFHNVKDGDIIKALQDDTEPFNKLVKVLLRQHYKLD